MDTSPHLPAALGLLLLTASCATYRDRTDEAMRAFRAGRLVEAEQLFADRSTTESEFLSGAEAGTAAFVDGRYQDAVEQFTRAVDQVRELEDKALLDPEALGETLVTWVVNETWTSYEGEGYERAMLHACLGLAYLGLGQVQDVMVEVRRCNDLLSAEESLYDTEYRAGGLAHFLSAVGYELQGQPDEAYIDYLNLEEKGLGGLLVGRSLERLATELGRDDDLAEWRARWGAGELPAPDAARVILIAGVGLGPFKEEVRLDIPTREGTLAWAVPQFHTVPQPVSSLILDVDGTRLRTALLEDVTAVAKQNLSDRIGWLAAKSAVRAVIKRELTGALSDSVGSDYEGVAWLVGSIFSIATERADLRSWTTLPGSWHAARLFVQPGVVELRLEAEGGDALDLGRLSLQPGETVFVLARTLDRRVYASVLGGGAVPEGTPTGPLAPVSDPEGEVLPPAAGDATGEPGEAPAAGSEDEPDAGPTDANAPDAAPDLPPTAAPTDPSGADPNPNGSNLSRRQPCPSTPPFATLPWPASGPWPA